MIQSIVFFDNEHNWKNLLPLTYTRPVSEIRIGICKIEEKWKLYYSSALTGNITQPYLQKAFPQNISKDTLFVLSCVLPDETLVSACNILQANEALFSNDTCVAYRGTKEGFDQLNKAKRMDYKSPVFMINSVTDIFTRNGEAIKHDFTILTRNRRSLPLSNTVTVIGDKNLVFLEEGAVAEACIINTKGGPVYIGKDAEVMEGAVIRGPFALCEHSVLKLSAKIYGPTTVGPHSKVGGEVNNSVIFGYSNKAHDGFLGNSVIGEWCNLGADTNNSNLKNNYANVKLFNYSENKQVDTGLQFCGLIMGDYSKSGINTMFNTGTVVGVGANIFGGGFPSTHIPSFSWGGSEGFETYKTEKLFETSEKVFERRGLSFGEIERELLQVVFDLTEEYRKY
jgi:UDP-N-acetylglucosamine diphosphorylase/glucosamine-1-phosphate N-acetyltransferase